LRRYLIGAAACSAFYSLYAASQTYRAEVAEWRRQRDMELRADGGWLTVTGLFWLHEGANPFGSGPSNEIVLPNDPALKSGAAFILEHGKVVMRMDGRSRDLRADSEESADIVTLASLSLSVGNPVGSGVTSPIYRRIGRSNQLLVVECGPAKLNEHVVELMIRAG